MRLFAANLTPQATTNNANDKTGMHWSSFEAKKQLFSGHPTGHDPLFDWTKQTGHEHSKKGPRIVVIFPSSTESTIIKGGNQDKYSIYL
jgi:hypothetical protein